MEDFSLFCDLLNLFLFLGVRILSCHLFSTQAIEVTKQRLQSQINLLFVWVQDHMGRQILEPVITLKIFLAKERQQPAFAC